MLPLKAPQPADRPRGPAAVAKHMLDAAASRRDAVGQAPDDAVGRALAALQAATHSLGGLGASCPVGPPAPFALCERLDALWLDAWLRHDELLKIEATSRRTAEQQALLELSPKRRALVNALLGRATLVASEDELAAELWPVEWRGARATDRPSLRARLRRLQCDVNKNINRCQPPVYHWQITRLEQMLRLEKAP